MQASSLGRHRPANQHWEGGASIAYVSRVLGHANPAITLSVYAHAFAAAEHGDAMRRKMESAFGEVLG